MSAPHASRPPAGRTHLFRLEFPQSLAVYDDYASAQRTVDFLSDEQFPVQNCMIVGTDLKQVERITGRMSYPKAAGAGALSGLWLGLFVGAILWAFSDEGIGVLVATMLIGAAFGIVWAVLGYAATGGRRDFSSVTSVVATRYEVLVEHRHAAQARELLARLPGAVPDPFA